MPHALAFAVIDAQSIPFPVATFEAVIANHMLYHVPDWATALAEIRRVLTPGGRFYASTVGPQHLREMTSFFPDHEGDFGTEYAFDLENGREQLRAYFAHVERHRYEDALVVTEPEPLIAYLLSTRVASVLDEADRAELTRRVADRMKEIGLFIAS